MNKGEIVIDSEIYVMKRKDYEIVLDWVDDIRIFGIEILENHNGYSQVIEIDFANSVSNNDGYRILDEIVDNLEAYNIIADDWYMS